jgi:molybdopterin-guanine dinucleotide biosynthesis protein A
VLSHGEPSPLAGAVLAGGQSRRMGRDKALLPLGGVPMIRILTDRLARIAEPVVVIADRADRYSFLGVPVLADLRTGCGPLGGIHTALRQLDAEEVFVLACDTPFVSEELIAYIAAFPTDAPARVALMDGRLHPLCGVYSRACLPAIEEAIAAERFALRELLGRIDGATVELRPDLPFYSPRLLMNLNDPAALGALDPGDR